MLSQKGGICLERTKKMIKDINLYVEKLCEEPNVHRVIMSVKEARNYLDGAELSKDFDEAIDEAQGDVHGGASAKSFLVIEILP